MRTLAPPSEVSPDAARGIVRALLDRPDMSEQELLRLFRRFPRARGRLFKKSELIQWIRKHGPQHAWPVQALVARLRMKPVRSHSGVLPVTVLTKPFPCPGRCVFCPSDVRMPKSYLSSEPGARRAAMFRFDPFAQVTARLFALAQNGHVVDKVELIVLGGTWTRYPESYRIGFILRCFEALNAFNPDADLPELALPEVPYQALPQQIDGGRGPGYNRLIRRFWKANSEGELEPTGTWTDLERVHRANQDARCRNVGLSVETRPDEIDPQAVRGLRLLGATKIQLGLQSMNDAVLRRNARGHTVRESRIALSLLRAAGFKIQVHWMANLVGSTPAEDKADYLRVFDDPDIRPDELKFYPTSLVESAELMEVFRGGGWRPYSDDELLEVVRFGLEHTPRTCRLSRVIRDIPGTDIVVGNREPNFRERAEQSVLQEGGRLQDIRAREIRGAPLRWEALKLRATEFESAIGQDVFLEMVDPRDRLAAFCRLSLPDGRVDPPFVRLRGCALIRELHVYGPVASLSEPAPESRAQHGGLGQFLLAEAEDRARRLGFSEIAVISAVGTRRYYERLGYRSESAYHFRRIDGAGSPRCAGGLLSKS